MLLSAIHCHRMKRMDHLNFQLFILVIFILGKTPSNDIPYDTYPVVVSQKDTNRKVLIVHAAPYTKYIGDIRIIFDERDEVTHWEGNQIYLDSSIKEDQSILKKLKLWSTDVDKIGKRLIEETKVFLNGTCDSGECNLANLITDAMVDMYTANISIALTTAISIQNSIPAGPILYEDLYTALPYNETWDLIELQGKDLLQVLENNVARSQSSSSLINSQLVHWSGLKVTYNLNNAQSKLISAKARRHGHNEFEDIDAEKWYRIVVPGYLLTNAFKIIKEKHRNHLFGITKDLENLVTYVEKIKTVDIGIEERMIFL